MPALGLHVMQARKCFDHIETKIELDRGFVGASAISHDHLALLPGGYGRVFTEAHEKKTDEYFLTLIKHIKNNALRETPNAMAFLYGQIMHYALDTSTHPLIYYMTECHPAKFVISALGAHSLFESWYDMRYEEMEKLAGKTFSPRYAFETKVSGGGIDSIIDAVYDKVYGLKNAAKGFRNGIKLWEIYQLHLRSFILNRMKGYHADFEQMLNPGGERFFHPVTNAPLTTTFSQAYEASFALACELIRMVNGNIYDGDGNEDALAIALGNSYDTGVDWKNSAVFYGISAEKISVCTVEYLRRRNICARHRHLLYDTGSSMRPSR